ncbi:hypothetical protein OF83DRAFT_1086151 [Amylostereum chailletii]|nr:hypothetical protein OF83DRAFT_1086151 [Amylostereum chailletii]
MQSEFWSKDYFFSDAMDALIEYFRWRLGRAGKYLSSRPIVGVGTEWEIPGVKVSVKNELAASYLLEGTGRDWLAIPSLAEDGMDPPALPIYLPCWWCFDNVETPYDVGPTFVTFVTMALLKDEDSEVSNTWLQPLWTLAHHLDCVANTAVDSKEAGTLVQQESIQQTDKHYFVTLGVQCGIKCDDSIPPENIDSFSGYKIHPNTGDHVFMICPFNIPDPAILVWKVRVSLHGDMRGYPTVNGVKDPGEVHGRLWPMEVWNGAASRGGAQLTAAYGGMEWGEIQGRCTANCGPWGCGIGEDPGADGVWMGWEQEAGEQRWCPPDNPPNIAGLAQRHYPAEETHDLKAWMDFVKHFAPKPDNAALAMTVLAEGAATAKDFEEWERLDKGYMVEVETLRRIREEVLSMGFALRFAADRMRAETGDSGARPGAEDGAAESDEVVKRIQDSVDDFDKKMMFLVLNGSLHKQGKDFVE